MDLRTQPIEDVLSQVEDGLGLRLEQQTLVRKRRSLGARTDRGTWVRIEVRSLADATVTDHEWVPAHADLNWANLTSPECGILDWEDHGLAPRGLDAATLWISSLTVPTLAERVSRERRADLETRSGKLMALFHCAKIITDSGAATSPVFELAAREAAKLVADLHR